MPLIAPLAAAIWNSLGPALRRFILWFISPKFIVGVSGIILDSQGRILLFRHRFWKDQPWGLPGGMAHPGESLGATLRRELLEEAAVHVTPSQLLLARPRPGAVMQFFLLAHCDAQPSIASTEILEARYFDPALLPSNLESSQRSVLADYFSRPWPALPLD